MDDLNELIAKVQAIVDVADRYRSCYFWRSPGSASSRRWQERRDSQDEVCWEEGGHQYSASFDVRCTCSNVYGRGAYTKDGRSTTLTSIRNSLKRLREKVVS